MEEPPMTLIEGTFNEEETIYTSVTDAFINGTPRDVLFATGVRVAQALDSTSVLARDMASLSKRVLEITRELEAEDIRMQKEATKGRVHVHDQSFNPKAI